MTRLEAYESAFAEAIAQGCRVSEAELAGEVAVEAWARADERAKVLAALDEELGGWERLSATDFEEAMSKLRGKP